MRMYTEMNIGVEFRKDLPPAILEILQKMVSLDDRIYTPPVKHELFECDRWRWMLHSDSYYFAAMPHCQFEFDDISESWYLTVITNLKNYSGEIEKFLDFIGPFLDRKNEFIGYKRYEEAEHPTLLYLVDGKIESKEI